MRLVRRLLVPALVAGVFCTPLFLHLGVRDQENDEAIYSYAVESLLETGDWMNPRFSPNPDVVFVEKPPLKFWIVALPIRLGLLPDNEVGLRIWDAIFGSLAFLYIFSFGRRMAGWLCGAVALLVLFTFETLLVQHGLRSNNMEAPLVLAYAGGVYHFLRWAESESAGRGRAHAAAVGACFGLALMTKFVAACFLPAMLAAASLELPAVRAKVARQWRTWAAVAAGVVVVAAPWFVYQTLQPGRGVWTIMLGEHVVRRFSDSLDPAHLKPWDFYFRSLHDSLSSRGTLWIVIGGALLVHARVLRERWLPGTLTVYWFWMPFVLMSLGTSKLWHYAYPFLPAVGLAAGCLVAGVTAALGDVARGRPLAWPAWPEASRVGNRVRAWWSQVGRRLPGARPGLRAAAPWVQGFLMAAAVVVLALGGLGLLHPDRFRLLGILVRPRPAAQAGAIAVALGLLAGRGAWTARIAVPMMLLSFMSVPQYRDQVARMAVEDSPVRTSRDCIARVDEEERAAGRPARGMLVALPTDFLHPFFFYYRHVGWDRHDDLDDRELMRVLDDPAEQRPVLLPRSRFLAARQAADPTPDAWRVFVRVSAAAIVVLPGPYAKCGG